MRLPCVQTTKRTLIITVAIVAVNILGDLLAIAAWPRPVSVYALHDRTYEFMSDGSTEFRFNHAPPERPTLVRPASAWCLFLVWCPIAASAGMTRLTLRATRVRPAGCEGPTMWLCCFQFTL